MWVTLASGPVERDSVLAAVGILPRDNITALAGRTVRTGPQGSQCTSEDAPTLGPLAPVSLFCFLLVINSGLFLDSSRRDGSPDPGRTV